MRPLRRAKRRFRTARAAWIDIGRRTGISARRVRGKRHTRTHWVFLVL